MDVYSTEEQQVESIKKWWRDNGKAVALGAIIGIGGLYGWRYFQAEQQTQSEQALDAYVKIVDVLEADPLQGQKQAIRFIKDNPGSYAGMLELQLAKSFVEAGDLVSAAAQLRLTQASTDEIFKTLSTLRLARIEAQLGNVSLALAELNKVKLESWKAQVEELRGDIELQNGDLDAARSAYMASIAVAKNPQVQMKLDNMSQ